MTYREDFLEREERQCELERRLDREYRFREPTDEEIRAELKRREQAKLEATDGTPET